MTYLTAGESIDNAADYDPAALSEVHGYIADTCNYSFNGTRLGVDDVLGRNSTSTAQPPAEATPETTPTQQAFGKSGNSTPPTDHDALCALVHDYYLSSIDDLLALWAREDYSLTEEMIHGAEYDAKWYPQFRPYVPDELTPAIDYVLENADAFLGHLRTNGFDVSKPQPHFMSPFIENQSIVSTYLGEQCVPDYEDTMAGNQAP